MGLIKKVLINCQECEKKIWHRVFPAGDFCTRCGTQNYVSRRRKVRNKMIDRINYKVALYWILFLMISGIIIVSAIIFFLTKLIIGWI